MDADESSRDLICPDCGCSLQRSAKSCEHCGTATTVEDWERALAEFRRRAEACGVSAKDAENALADSIDVAQKLMPSSASAEEKLTFLTSTALKEWDAWVTRRFVLVDRCADSRDYEEVERVWLEYYEPMWLAGCDFWIEFKRKCLRDDVFSHYGSRLGSMTAHDRRELNQYVRDYGNAVAEAQRAILAKYQDVLRESQRITIEKMRDYDRHHDR